MDKETTQEIPGLLDYAVQLQAQDKTSHEIKRALKEKGADDILALRITQQSEDIYFEIANKKAKKSILWGSVWLLGGLIVTLASYKAGGNKFILTYGAILGGLIQLLGGLYKKSQL